MLISLITPLCKSTVKEGRISKRFQCSSDFMWPLITPTQYGGVIVFFFYIYGYYFRETLSDTFMGRHIAFPPWTLLVKPKSLERHLLFMYGQFFLQNLKRCLNVMGKNIPWFFDQKAERETKKSANSNKKRKKIWSPWGHVKTPCVARINDVERIL